GVLLARLEHVLTADRGRRPAQVALERARGPELDPAHREQLRRGEVGRQRLGQVAAIEGRLKSDDGVTSCFISACTTRCWRSVRVMSLSRGLVVWRMRA